MDNEETNSSSFWNSFNNYGKQSLSFLGVQQLLQIRSHHIGLTICEYLKKIEDIQDGYNYQQEEGIGGTMAAYLGVSAFGMFVNLFTLVIMFNSTNLTRPRNYLIVSHMFTDCVQCSITMPITLLMTFHFYWYLDDFSCKMASFLKAASFYSSFLTLSFLAAHQFISYNFKFNSHWFLLIFVLSSLFAMPYVFAVSTEVVDYYEPWNNDAHLNKALLECNMSRPIICSESSWDRVPFVGQEFYMIMTLFLLYALPVFCLFLSYITCKSSDDKNRIRGIFSYSGMSLKNRENFLMLSFLVFVFLLHWLPMTLFTLFHLFGLVEFTYNRYLIFQTIGVSTSIFKPIIYGLTNSGLRSMYTDTIRSIFCPCGLCARPQRNHIRRLIRLGLGRSVTETGEEMALYDEEVFTQSTRFRSIRKYQPVALSGSQMNRTMIYANRQPLRRGHYSLR